MTQTSDTHPSEYEASMRVREVEETCARLTTENQGLNTTNETLRGEAAALKESLRVVEAARDQLKATGEELARQLSESHRKLEKMTEDHDTQDRRRREAEKSNHFQEVRLDILENIGAALVLMLVGSDDRGDLNFLKMLIEAGKMLEVEDPRKLVPEFTEMLTRARFAHLEYQVENLNKAAEEEEGFGTPRDLSELLRQCGALGIRFDG